MEYKRELSALTIGLALLAAPTAAQNWTVTVTSDGALESSDLNNAAVNSVTDPTAANLTVNCQTTSRCDDLQVELRQQSGFRQPLGRLTDTSTFLVPAGPLQGQVMDLAFDLGNRELGSFRVTAEPPPTVSVTSVPSPAVAVNTTTGTAAANNNSNLPTFAEMITASCPDLTITVHKGKPCVEITGSDIAIGYDAKGNCGAMVVSPTGRVLARAVDTFDENDELRVIVYGDVLLLPTLKVERTSAFRDVQTLRIVGQGSTVPQQLITNQAGAVCGTLEFRLADFAPGQGKFQISSYQNDEWVALGSGDFNVDPLYSGMFSLGGAWTDLVDPDFKLAANGSGGNVIAVGGSGKNELLYTLFYTPFVWGKRDLEKRVPWYGHINPSFGIVPQKVDENAMVGITIDLPQGLLFTFGRHYRRITVLPDSTGLTPGSPFMGTAAEIPTASKWRDDNFFAVTIDLRAAVQLFTAAFGGGGNQ